MAHERITIYLDIDINDGQGRNDIKEDQRFAQAIEYGLSHSAEIGELAEICCQSISTFKRRFRERFSMPPHKWFQEHKLEIAYKIISERDISVTELTRISGYSNVSHFISAFRKRYGLSPARLIKKLRELQQDDNKKKATDTKE